MFCVYVLENPAREKYIGFTNDLQRRLHDHNAHQNISTKHQGPWKLIYCEAYVHKMDALGREKFLNSGAGWRFLKKQLQHYLMGTEGNLP